MNTSVSLQFLLASPNWNFTRPKTLDAGATSSSRHHLDDDRRRRNDHGAARLPHRDVVETGNDNWRFESRGDDYVAFDAHIG